MIPRTQRVQAEQLRVLPPAEFAPLLIERLERVKRELDNKERLERRLAEVTVLYSLYIAYFRCTSSLCRQEDRCQSYTIIW